MKRSTKAPGLKLEILNSLLHGFGVLFALIGIPILIARAARNNNITSITASGIYGFCFLMVFVFSTLYHGFQQPKIKAVFKILDHISIYFLIAGTYTPIVLIFVNNSFGITLLVVLWSLTIVGIFFKIFFTGRFEIASTIAYILMGWILFAGGKTFFAAMPAHVIVLITVGGVLYSCGVIFYLWQKYTYHHAIWHLFVLAAAICHYLAVFIAVTPGHDGHGRLPGGHKFRRDFKQDSDVHILAQGCIPGHISDSGNFVAAPPLTAKTRSGPGKLREESSDKHS